MKNPLTKRLPRELRHDFGKHLVIFLLMMLSIGLISGFLVVDNSVKAAYDESFEKYTVEDGHFSTKKALSRAQLKAIGELNISLYDLSYREITTTGIDSTLRIYKNRSEINRADVLSGSLPEAADEIAIDRMYAQNNHIGLGDRIGNDTGSWTVTGLIALSDYSALFSDNSDSMFDSIKFGVAVVTDEGFRNFGEKNLTHNYAWLYDTPPSDEAAARDMADELKAALRRKVKLSSFLPRYQNQAINFTGDDMGSDKAMMTVFLYIVMAILAFVFAVMSKNTIHEESEVIGTLRALGYTRGELIRHYMAMPVSVTILSALIGNILGYTVFIGFFVDMYYNSYSLTAYHTLWNADAFLLTTVFPILIMTLINLLSLNRSFRLSPLDFLRRHLSRRRNRRAIPLNPSLPFMARFSLRVIFQNLSSYLVLFIGILFADVLLLFGLGLPAVIDHYMDTVQSDMLAPHQYLLSVPDEVADEDFSLSSLIEMLMIQSSLETENETAEKFMAYSLNIQATPDKTEDVLLYGIDSQSRYVDLEPDQEDVWISSAYADKYLLKAGDTLILNEPYEDKTYELTVTGIYPYDSDIAVFMSRRALNRMLELDEDYYAGYFSETPITDIDSRYIGSEITMDDLTKICRQMTVSMGDFMDIIKYFAIAIYIILMYLLIRLSIEKNSQSIAMAKILGYRNHEIFRLYLLPAAVMTMICLVLSLPLDVRALIEMCRIAFITEMNGWLPLSFDNSLYIRIFLYGLACFIFVGILEYFKICRIPREQALKTQGL